MSKESPSPIDPHRIMEEVRERVRSESLAEDEQALTELRILSREIGELREKLADSRRVDPKLLQLTVSLDDPTLCDLDEADQTHEIPPARKIDSLPPLRLIFKAYRKAALKGQRLFNHAVARLLRRSFQNFLLVEKYQLLMLEEMSRLDELEERLKTLEQKIQSMENTSDS